MSRAGRVVVLGAAYSGVFAIIPLLFVDDPATKWHARQGLVLGVLGAVLAFLPLVGCWAMVLWLAVAGAAFVLAVRGQPARIPLVAGLCDRMTGG